MTQKLLTQSVDADAPGFSDTSAEALAKVKPAIPSIRQRVLDSITMSGTHGQTASELIEELGALDYSVRPRITELRKAGVVQAAPFTRINGRDNNETVFILGDADEADGKPKYNVDEYARVLNSYGITQGNLINNFIFSATPEGSNFWFAVRDKLKY